MASAENATPRLRQLYTWLEERSTAFRSLVAYCAVLLIGFLDYLSGYQVSFAIFYLLPIGYVAWSLGKRPGVLISIVSAAIWLEADVLSGQPYSDPIFLLWNATVRLGFFLTVVLLIAKLNEILAREKESAKIDSLTGIANRRGFYAALNLELQRAKRYQHSFTLAYIDLDNFKAVNDQLGHSAGDILLSTIAQRIKERIRSTDTVSRLGGDEFAILFPETRFETSCTLMQDLRTHLLDALQSDGWTVTFSIGAVTFDLSAASADDAIRISDNAMYRAKNDGKNRIILDRFPQSAEIIQLSTQEED